MLRPAGLLVFRLFGSRAVGSQWTMLLILSVLFALLMQALRLPAALLLGPVAAGVVISAAGGVLRVPLYPFLAAQAVIGCLIARSIPAAIFGEIGRDWPLFLAAVVAVIAAS